MITDEQIKQLAVSCGFKLTNENGDDLKPYVYEFARELIALAQQVKPLEFKCLHSAVFAHTAIGDYEILHTVDDIDGRPEAEGYYYELANSGALEAYETEAEAIAAANEDYRRRVLGCLVNGGSQ